MPMPFWAADVGDVLESVHGSADGLSSAEAAARVEATASRRIRRRRRSSWRVLLRQVASPLVLLLVFAAAASWITGAAADAIIVLTIVAATAGVGFWREDRAERAAAALQARLRTRATVLRDGSPTEVPLDEVVPGDVVLLAAGSLVPGDGRLVEANAFHVNEAVLTGESFPVEKSIDPVPRDAPVRARTDAVFLGTNVRSGSARAVIVRIGLDTEFGSVAARLAHRAPVTEFDRGVRRFGYLLTVAMLCLVLIVFAAHMVKGREPVDTLLFSIALAVGLSPELLPAVLTVNLARGAQVLAAHGVLVRRLNAIENLGSMDVLCCDKTGTLTAGVIRVDGAYDDAGLDAPDVLRLARTNAMLQTGLGSPLDTALLQDAPPAALATKLGEIPFDFSRKRLSVVVGHDDGALVVTKGAVDAVLETCSTLADGRPLSDDVREALAGRTREWGAHGLRVLAVATRAIACRARYDLADEDAMALAGFVTFLDEPKAGVRDSLVALGAIGVRLKMITGDSAAVAGYVASRVGLAYDRIVTGAELRTTSPEALWRLVDDVTVFAEVDPDQKERIILALKRAGHVIGFLGDGVNDAPAMHAADTSLSVEDAVDVAREAADFVLLEQDLDVIRHGVQEGRRTFANTLKYILVTSSANVGNMLSVAGASLFLPFLPLLPGQILLNNFLTDVPAIGIADDSVDPEQVAQPERWHIGFIGRFMVLFGFLSSVFDVVTFLVLLQVFAAAPVEFRTGWFVESSLTEVAALLVMRTRRSCFRSRPGRLLMATSAVVAIVTLAIPYLPWAGALGFMPVPAGLMGTVVAITLGYIAATELLKRAFYTWARRPILRSPSHGSGVGSGTARSPNWRTA